MNQPQVTPAAILAAVLFNLSKTVEIEDKFSDKEGGQKMKVPVVQITEEEGAIMCSMPLSKVLHFAANNYAMHFNTVRPNESSDFLAVVGFEKQEKVPTLVSMNGKPLQTGATHFKKLFNSIFGKEAQK